MKHRCSALLFVPQDGQYMTSGSWESQKQFWSTAKCHIYGIPPYLIPFGWIAKFWHPILVRLHHRPGSPWEFQVIICVLLMWTLITSSSSLAKIQRWGISQNLCDLQITSEELETVSSWNLDLSIHVEPQIQQSPGRCPGSSRWKFS